MPVSEHYENRKLVFVGKWNPNKANPVKVETPSRNTFYLKQININWISDDMCIRDEKGDIARIHMTLPDGSKYHVGWAYNEIAVTIPVIRVDCHVLPKTDCKAVTTMIAVFDPPFVYGEGKEFAVYADTGKQVSVGIGCSGWMEEKKSTRKGGKTVD